MLRTLAVFANEVITQHSNLAAFAMKTMRKALLPIVLFILAFAVASVDELTEILVSVLISMQLVHVSSIFFYDLIPILDFCNIRR
jgi:hypothetical protein